MVWRCGPMYDIVGLSLSMSVLLFVSILQSRPKATRDTMVHLWWSATFDVQSFFDATATLTFNMTCSAHEVR
jgi:hypothetical protein